jgi:hypothetical protein
MKERAPSLGSGATLPQPEGSIVGTSEETELLRRPGIGGATVTVVVAALFLAFAAVPGSARPARTPLTHPGDEAPLTILGVERDRRLGRAWLLARLAVEGHLRTVSGRIKAFAPPGEYEAGFVRIPVIPKTPTAKRLRIEGHVEVDLIIYLDPKNGPGVTVSRRLTLVRSRPAKPAGLLH